MQTVRNTFSGQGLLGRDVIDVSGSRSRQEDSTGFTLAAEACARQGFLLLSTYRGANKHPKKKRHPTHRTATQQCNAAVASAEPELGSLVQQAPQLRRLPPKNLGISNASSLFFATQKNMSARDMSTRHEHKLRCPSQATQLTR